MEYYPSIDMLFRQAVYAIDEGDEEQLIQLLEEHPELASERLRQPGQWLREEIGNALDSFFSEPYLLWFVAEDAVRKNTLPHNIARLAYIIIQKARSIKAASLKEQLDYTLRLVAWSWVARESKVQIPLMEVLIDQGAAIENVSNDALVNGNSGAAEYLLKRGANPTLATSLCLEHWQQADELAEMATDEQKQFSLILAALNGNAKAVSRVIGYGGVDINRPSEHLYSHATALHHAVCSGSMETVKILIAAGAKTNRRDSIHNGTPLDWAEYAGKKEIADYLKSLA